MKGYIISSFLLLLEIATSGAIQCADNCVKNEIYSKCATGSCQPTCWEKGTEDCDCIHGCVCDLGLIRDPNTYKCIAPADCPPKQKCPRNEEWSEYHAGCQKTCHTQDVEYKCQPVPGCICRDGYIRSAISGQCIPISKCTSCPPGYSLNPHTYQCNFCCQESCCPENEEYNECGPYCEATCTDPLRLRPCIFLCKEGCTCKPGFVRDTRTEKCVPKEKCCKYIFHIICVLNTIAFH